MTAAEQRELLQLSRASPAGTLCPRRAAEPRTLWCRGPLHLRSAAAGLRDSALPRRDQRTGADSRPGMPPVQTRRLPPEKAAQHPAQRGV